MLESMKRIGAGILDERGIGIENRQLGFHVPPFTSVSHLHLHVLATPFNGIWRKAKYMDHPFARWYVPIDRVIGDLSAQRLGGKRRESWGWGLKSSTESLK